MRITLVAKQSLIRCKYRLFNLFLQTICRGFYRKNSHTYEWFSAH